MNDLHFYLSGFFWSWVIAAARFYGVMAICPLFSKSHFSNFLKLVLSLSLSIIIFPAFINQIIDTTFMFRVLYLIKEFCYGAFLGYLFGFPFWIIESAGNFIDIQSGQQLGQIVNNLTGNLDSIFGNLLLQGFYTYFVVANGLLYLFGIVFKSYDLFPPNQLVPSGVNLAERCLSFFSSYFYYSVVVALPIIAVLFIIDISVGIIGAFLPALNITVFSMPIKSVAAITILIIYLTTMYHQVLIHFVNQLKGIM